jgi:hypothetical protein
MNCPLCGHELPRCGMNCGLRRMKEKEAVCNSLFFFDS